MRKTFHRIFLTATVCLLLCAGIAAADGETLYRTEYCFREGDFSTADMGGVDGIFVTAVPDASVAVVKLGNRTVCVGDTVAAASLNDLRLVPTCTETKDAVLTYCPIYGTYPAAPTQLTIRIQSGKNEAPKAANVDFETYKNIANDGKLSATDKEGGELTFQLVDAPKRGTVTISDDGTFVYTPRENKVGEDRFTYTATDDAGNVSKPATVNIRILDPKEKMTFSDLSDDPGCFEAMWLREQGLCGGRTIGAQTCFYPQETVSRGEFLVMAMELFGITPDAKANLSSVCDADDVPVWMQSYLSAALRRDIVRGRPSPDGLCFAANDAITGREAAVMLQNILELPVPTATVKTSQADWSANAVAALSDAGICMDYGDTSMTRIEVANLLYRVSGLT